jgi:RNA recognition motif-containing protein
MNIKLYVDNLAAATTTADLVALFSVYGDVAETNVAVDDAHHNPRGFGFVTMVTPEGAKAAIQALNGRSIGTCALSVSEACPAERHRPAGSGRRTRRSISHLY